MGTGRMTTTRSMLRWALRLWTAVCWLTLLLVEHDTYQALPVGVRLMVFVTAALSVIVGIRWHIDAGVVQHVPEPPEPHRSTEAASTSAAWPAAAAPSKVLAARGDSRG